MKINYLLEYKLKEIAGVEALIGVLENWRNGMME
jgi:hypothetical protein